MPKYFFTSDWHINHKNIMKYSHRFDFLSKEEIEQIKSTEESFRISADMVDGQKWQDKFRKEIMKIPISDESMKRMEDHIVDHVNSLVGPDDILWNLGDLGCFKDIDQYLTFRRRIKCRNFNVIWGNHDDDKGRFSDIRTWYEQNKLTFINEAHDLKLITVSVGEKYPIRIVLSHYAMAVWNKNHKGSWCLYGHSHGSFEEWRNTYMPDAKCLDVGIDYRAQVGLGYTIWSLDDLRDYMATKKGHLVDHHK